MRSLKVQFANLEGVSPSEFGFNAELVLLVEYDNEKEGIPGYTKVYDVPKGDKWGNRLAVFTKDLDVSVSEVSLAHNEIALHITCGEKNIIHCHLLSTSSCEDSDKVRAHQILDIVKYTKDLSNVTIVGDFNCCSSPNALSKLIAKGVKEFRGATGIHCQNALEKLSRTLQLQNPGMRTFPTLQPVRGYIVFPAPILCLDQVWSTQTVKVNRERFGNKSDHFGLTLKF